MKRGTPRKRVKLMSRFFTALPPEPPNETGERPKKTLKCVKVYQMVSKTFIASPPDPSNEAGDPSKESGKKVSKRPFSAPSARAKTPERPATEKSGRNRDAGAGV